MHPVVNEPDDGWRIGFIKHVVSKGVLMTLIPSIVLQANDGVTRAEFYPQYGGLCTSLLVPDGGAPGGRRELLYLPEKFDVSTNRAICAGLPFHFPICGRLAREGAPQSYLLEGRYYAMDIHGFSHQHAWDVIFSSCDQLVMQQKANEKTRSQFPFNYELQLSYALHASTLQAKLVIRNADHKAMPFYTGFHPYLAIDLKRYHKRDIQLQFQALKSFRYNATLTDIVGERACAVMPAALSDPGINERLSLLGQDKRVFLRFPDGFQLEQSVYGEADTDLFAYLQLYHQMDKPFFCIEPWMAFPNALNAVQGVKWLAPGATIGAIFLLKASYTSSAR